MKYVKFGFLAMMVLVIAILLQGCGNSGDNNSKNRDKAKASAGKQSNSPMFFMPGEEKDMYVQGDKIMFLPGKITDFREIENGMSAAYVIDGQLYLNHGGNAKKVDTCTKIVALSDFANAVIYLNENNEISIYNRKTEKRTTYSPACSLDEIEDIVLDPTGKAFVYHNDNMNTMHLCRDGKLTNLGALEYMEEIEKVSANGDGVYILGG